MKKQFIKKIELIVTKSLYTGLKGHTSIIPVTGFRKCPYNYGKPCKAIHNVKVSNAKIVKAVAKLFLDKIK